jgi:hypothetical protein
MLCSSSTSVRLPPVATQISATATAQPDHYTLVTVAAWRCHPFLLRVYATLPDIASFDHRTRSMVGLDAVTVAWLICMLGVAAAEHICLQQHTTAAAESIPV